MILNFNDKETILKEALHQYAEPSLANWKKDIYSFIIWYMDTSGELIQKTSGSTGVPKSISLSRNVLEASAQATISFFDLSPNSSALLCISASYIGGKMMILRAILGKWKLTCIEPSSFSDASSLPSSEKFDFAAMIPLQVRHLLVSSPKFLSSIGQLIIGGAPVTADLEEKIIRSKVSAYSTYGMTETASHVALKKLNSSKVFTALDGISFSVDEHSRLILTGDRIPNSPLLTNDVVSLLTSSSFKWLGRFDSIINSGGIKILTEELEQKIATLIPHSYYIKKSTHELLGETPVLVIQGQPWSEDQLASLREKMLALLPKFWTPTKIEFKSIFEKTDSGKVKRN